jgi:ribosome-associated translation inhibitor RaiA
MQTPLEITFRGMSSSPALETQIHHWVSRLERSCDNVQHCAVVVEMPHQHSEQGNRFVVRIEVTVPGLEIAVSQEPGHADAKVAVAEAFRAARRQLQDHAQIRRGD